NTTVSKGGIAHLRSGAHASANADRSWEYAYFDRPMGGVRGYAQQQQECMRKLREDVQWRNGQSVHSACLPVVRRGHGTTGICGKETLLRVRANSEWKKTDSLQMRRPRL